MITSIVLSEGEIVEQKLHANTLKMAKHIFDVHGFLKIENLFPKEFIHQLADAYTSQLQFNAEEMTLGSGANVSHRRYIVPIDFKPPFNDPQLYANTILMPLMKEILGLHFILSTLGVITALPGSTDQHLHADYFPLFEESLPASNMVPAFAVTFAVPLIDIDLLNGPTKIWSGSHHTYPIEQNMHSYTKHLLSGPVGSCYFWDYRTFHAGGSNHSEQMRSLLYMAYTRRWFKDFSNPDFLQMDEENLAAIPAEHSHLFAHLQRPAKATKGSLH
jgi:ectoine hydroxylase-related dioxygenase (phytanoyl-CoA dioxygenase family)